MSVDINGPNQPYQVCGQRTHLAKCIVSTWNFLLFWDSCTYVDVYL